MRAPAIVIALLLVSPRADACPRCNLSFLTESVRSARKIYLGRVLRPLDQKRVEVRVEKVLRGPLKKGQRVKVSVRDPVWGVCLIDDKRDVGKLLLLSDPVVSKTGETVFPVLDPIFEEEVRLLMQRKPMITGVGQAIRMVQGVSNEAHTAGRAYIRRHRKAATGPLLKEIERIRVAVFVDRKADRHSYQATQRDVNRLAALARALVEGVRASTPGSAKVRTYVLRQVQRLLRHTWKARPDEAAIREWQTMFLGWLLSHTRKQGSLRREVRRRLERGYPGLQGEGIAAAVYLLVGRAAAPVASFSSLKRADKDEAVAAGLYYAAAHEQLGKARMVAVLRRAAALASSAGLKKKIAEQRSYLQTP